MCMAVWQSLMLNAFHTWSIPSWSYSRNQLPSVIKRCTCISKYKHTQVVVVEVWHCRTNLTNDFDTILIISWCFCLLSIFLAYSWTNSASICAPNFRGATIVLIFCAALIKPPTQDDDRSCLSTSASGNDDIMMLSSIFFMIRWGVSLKPHILRNLKAQNLYMDTSLRLKSCSILKSEPQM